MQYVESNLRNASDSTYHVCATLDELEITFMVLKLPFLYITFSLLRKKLEGDRVGSGMRP